MEFKSFFGRPVDYKLNSGLEEWENNSYKITDDFYRLEIGTEKVQKLLEEKTGKTVPLNKVICLDHEEMDMVRRIFRESGELCGSYGALRAKAFDTACFYERGKDGLATEEEVRYDHKWNEL